MLVQDFVQSKIKEGCTPKEISKIMGVSVSMVTQYKKDHYYASLDTAKKVYKELGIALHPFGEANLQLEVEKDDE